jgi:hypothetical protein
MPDRISFTRPAVERIANVVRAVENARPPGGPLTYGAIVNDKKPKPFRVCTFTGAWAIDTVKTVTFRNVTATPNTASAMNLFVDFTGSTAARTCAIAKDGTAWYLIAPVGQTADQPVVKMATFVGSWSINASKSVTLRTPLGTQSSISVTNLIYDLPDQGTLQCNVAKDGTAWFLVNVKHTLTDVITSVALGTAGLVFTRARVQVASTASASQITVGTTACT